VARKAHQASRSAEQSRMVPELGLLRTRLTYKSGVNELDVRREGGTGSGGGTFSWKGGGRSALRRKGEEYSKSRDGNEEEQPLFAVDGRGSEVSGQAMSTELDTKENPFGTRGVSHRS